MNAAQGELQTRLAAPGAGLPWIELQIARVVFAWQLSRSSREKAALAVENECEEILRLAALCNREMGTRRVLIRRLPGMEDSSRNWSVFMTVEHLHIVNTFIADTIEALGRGEVPVRAANTAAVKPETSADRSACALLEISCADVAKAARSISDLRTPIRHPHPWFGPLDAAAWHFMAGFHMKLHRRQIIAILQPL